VRWLAAVAIALALAGTAVAEKQHADARFTPKMSHPAYVTNGPVVAVDEGHRNFHTLEDKYAPFGKLLAADGYRVRASAAPFSAQSLAGVNVLVVANARDSVQGTAAFTPDEIAAVRQWVENGGSLLLIADHAPFGLAARPLAAAFGVDMAAGFVVVRQSGRITANIDFRGRQLGVHPILAGRDPSERVRAVKSFTGQSVGIPAGAVGLLLLPSGALGLFKQEDIQTLAQGGSVPGMHVGGRAQAVALSVGRGRVVVAGEAAMFTEQIIPDLGRVGLTAEDDQQFALNVLHWLSRALP
jgi:hypothetical protein